MLEEHGAKVHPPDEDVSLSMVASGPLDRIRAAVAQLHHEFPRSDTVIIEDENGDAVTGGAQPEPATRAAANGSRVPHQPNSPTARKRVAVARSPAAAVAPKTGNPGQRLGGKVVIIPGETRYHRRDCTLIRLLGNDDLETSTRQQAEAGGCMPCQACKPDRPLGAQT
jgi:hypothetical protein